MIENKCSIYGQHPQDPCKSYRCQWLVNDNVPGWMKPSSVNAILSARKSGTIEYLDITEAGGKLQAEVLSWAVMYALTNKLNLRYQISGGVNKIGSNEFLTSDLSAPPAAESVIPQTEVPAEKPSPAPDQTSP